MVMSPEQQADADDPHCYRFHKPYGVLTQFTDQQGRETLADYIDIPDIYAAGRLDRDSEGLLLLTDNGALQQHISHPRHKLMKCYWVQVEGEISDQALHQLRVGVALKDGMTAPAIASRMDEPQGLWPRNPPVRYRAAIPTSWLKLSISEGRNRQVRRMTAAVGFPTLRLIRYAIDSVTLDGLQPGQISALGKDQIQQMMSGMNIKKRAGRSGKKWPRSSRGAGKTSGRK